MAEYGYLYVVQATTRSGETLTCSIGDVKEFCTELSQEMRSNRKATMKLLFDKATDVARKVRITSKRRITQSHLEEERKSFI